jgi:hypothetical protein
MYVLVLKEWAFSMRIYRIVSTACRHGFVFSVQDMGSETKIHIWDKELPGKYMVDTWRNKLKDSFCKAFSSNCVMFD